MQKIFSYSEEKHERKSVAEAICVWCICFQFFFTAHPWTYYTQLTQSKTISVAVFLSFSFWFFFYFTSVSYGFDIIWNWLKKKRMYYYIIELHFLWTTNNGQCTDVNYANEQNLLWTKRAEKKKTKQKFIYYYESVKFRMLTTGNMKCTLVICFILRYMFHSHLIVTSFEKPLEFLKKLQQKFHFVFLMRWILLWERINLLRWKKWCAFD